MPPYYRNSRWNSSRQYWAHYHQNKHSELASYFGGIERDILKIFLNLSPYLVDGLLGKYGEKFGRNAEQYARKTYTSWRTGSVQPSGTTVEKLIELLPPFLTEAERFDLIRKLRTHHLNRENVRLTTVPGNWHEELRNLITRLIDNAAKSELPPKVYEKATWLTNGDAVAARKLLQVIDEEEARTRLGFIQEEFHRIEYLVNNIKNAEPVRHTIHLPQGTIFVTIERQKQPGVKRLLNLLTRGQNMEEESNKLIPRASGGGEVIKRPTSGSLLDSSLASLPKGQQEKLAEKVADEKVQLAVSAEKAEQRHFDSTRDMANTIKAAAALEQTTRSDYEVKGSFDTASGRTDIRIKKNNNTVIVVVAIVIGLIILILLRH